MSLHQHFAALGAFRMIAVFYHPCEEASGFLKFWGFLGHGNDKQDSPKQIDTEKQQLATRLFAEQTADAVEFYALNNVHRIVPPLPY